MPYPDLIYQIALTRIPHIGPVQAKILLQHCNVDEIFHARKSFLEKMDGIGPVRAAAITAHRDFSIEEKTAEDLVKNGVKPVFITDAAYPKRLLTCYDSPVLLYYSGCADLNASRMVAIVGTRNHTPYASTLVSQFVRDLASLQVTIVSGLALGVDALAHKAALENRLPTIGVLAHGPGSIYPPENKKLAASVLSNGGGLLTEFPPGTPPDRHHFPSRNRVVAGMCDATIVIETGLKGGSMITADLANGYNRDVFAAPGRLSDPRSEGCNHLIRNHKAALLPPAQEFAVMMGWGPETLKPAARQKEMFVELSEDEQLLVSIIGEKKAVHIDEISSRSGLSNSTMAAGILNLELKNVILSLPGKLYTLS